MTTALLKYVMQQTWKENRYVSSKGYGCINEHERLPNFTLMHKIK